MQQALVDLNRIWRNRVSKRLTSNNSNENTDVESHNAEHDERTESNHAKINGGQSQSEGDWLFNNDFCIRGVVSTM